MDRTEVVERLLEIKEEIEELLGEAESLLHDASKITQCRAESYWLAHMANALDGRHNRYDYTMQHTINEIESGEEG